MIHLETCTSYDPSEVRRAAGRAFGAVGGAAALIPPGARVLVKPNLLAARPPETAVTTHPAVVDAVLRIVLGRTRDVTVGDSPGLGDAHAVAEASGIAEVCRNLGVPVVDFRDSVQVKTAPGALFPALEVAREALDADVIINVPKLKTHGMIRLTMGVKNMFGCVVKARKPQWHFRAGGDAGMFAAMLVDVYERLRPAVTIMDAVVGMEGQGPGRGEPKPVGLLVAGVDAHQLDWTCARLVGFDPLSVPTLGVACGRDLLRPGEICSSVPPEPFFTAFAQPRPRDLTFSVPAVLRSLLHRHITTRPVVLGERCEGCVECLRICPAEAITVRGKLPRIDHARCIRCYCCHEVCPHAALDLRAGLLLRVYDKFWRRRPCG
ncbi:MAG: DUF362 domain-containing protein [Candidatus Brocadiia bacterium]|jgi:uncharacterized protein (DUF362 family)/Pyruvate/2-oxoacid:ferredoxin oxidoreductase delta subunit|nr:DUF362 domain-containing protein [Candidatus Brocadiia bacterium]